MNDKRSPVGSVSVRFNPFCQESKSVVEFHTEYYTLMIKINSKRKLKTTIKDGRAFVITQPLNN